eukprot:343967-Pyramimonas_sp.AAC.1
MGSEKDEGHKQELSEVRADFVDRRWTSLAGAWSAPRASLDSTPGGPNADPRNPSGAPQFTFLP